MTAKQRKAKERRAKRREEGEVTRGGESADFDDSDATRELLPAAASAGPAHDMREAVFGGQAVKTQQRFQNREEIRGAASVKYYSDRDEGQIHASRLVQSVKKGGVDMLYVLSPWNDHGRLNQIRATCKTHNVPCIMMSDTTLNSKHWKDSR
jgi:hypothetical protein